MGKLLHGNAFRSACRRSRDLSMLRPRVTPRGKPHVVLRPAWLVAVLIDEHGERVIETRSRMTRAVLETEARDLWRTPIPPPLLGFAEPHVRAALHAGGWCL